MVNGNEQRVQQLFSNIFEPELIDNVLEVGQFCAFEEGEILIDVGEEITSIPLMISGAIKIMREDNEGNEIFLYYVEPGSTCASSLTCCINNHKSNILAIVEDKAEFIAVPVDKMDDWMSRFKSWRHFILNNYADRYEELLYVVDLLAFKGMEERISNYLKEKAAVHHSTTVFISHQQIAIDLNTSREVVSRILKQMERAGAIQLKRGEILLNPIEVN